MYNKGKIITKRRLKSILIVVILLVFIVSIMYYYIKYEFKDNFELKKYSNYASEFTNLKVVNNYKIFYSTNDYSSFVIYNQDTETNETFDLGSGNFVKADFLEESNILYAKMEDSDEKNSNYYKFIDYDKVGLPNDEYDKIDDTFIKENIIILTKDEKSGILDTTNNQIIIPLEYDNLYCGYLEKYGLIIAQKDNKVGIINLKNETIIPFEYDITDDENSNLLFDLTSGGQIIQYENNNYYLLRKDDNIVLVNENNNIILESNFNNFEIWNEYIIITDDNNNIYNGGTKNYYNYDGTFINSIVIPDKAKLKSSDFISDDSSDRIYSIDNKKIYVVDKDLKLKEYTDVVSVSKNQSFSPFFLINDVIYLKQNNQNYELIKIEDDELIGTYNTYFYSDYSDVIVLCNDSCDTIDIRTGDVINKFEYEDIINITSYSGTIYSYTISLKNNEGYTNVKEDYLFLCSKDVSFNVEESIKKINNFYLIDDSNVYYSDCTNLVSKNVIKIDNNFNNYIIITTNDNDSKINLVYNAEGKLIIDNISSYWLLANKYILVEISNNDNITYKVIDKNGNIFSIEMSENISIETYLGEDNDFYYFETNVGIYYLSNV